MNPTVGLGIFLDAIQSSANYANTHMANGFVVDNSSTTMHIPLDQNERWIQQKSTQLLSLLRMDDVEAGIPSQSEKSVISAIEDHRILALQIVKLFGIIWHVLHSSPFILV